MVPDRDQFSTPHSIASDSKDNIYIANRGNNRIQVYNTDMKYQRLITGLGAPWSVCVSPGATQYIYSGDGGTGKIYKFDMSGKLLGWEQTSLGYSQSSWQWAQENYPGQGEYAFGVLEGWSIVERPHSSDVLPESYGKMGRYPYRGSVVAIDEAEKERLLDLTLEPVTLPNRRPLSQSLALDFLLRNDDLNRDANRIADLVFNRVTASGSLVLRTAPPRSAPQVTFCCAWQRS
jgi:hypothetical protein